MGGKGKGKKSKDKGEDGKGGAEGAFKKILKLKECDEGFRLRGALIGEKGRNIHHIQDATGAKLWIQGEGSDSMVVKISADEQEDLEKAVDMAKDLIKAVYREYDEWKQSNGNDEPPS